MTYNLKCKKPYDKMMDMSIYLYYRAFACTIGIILIAVVSVGVAMNVTLQVKELESPKITNQLPSSRPLFIPFFFSLTQ